MSMLSQKDDRCSMEMINSDIVHVSLIQSYGIQNLVLYCTPIKTVSVLFMRIHNQMFLCVYNGCIFCGVFSLNFCLIFENIGYKK